VRSIKSFIYSLILNPHSVTSVKHISKQMPATVSSSLYLRSSPSQPYLRPKAHSRSSQPQRCNSRAPSRSRSPSRQRSGRGSRARRASVRSGVIGRCGMRRARRGSLAGGGRAGIRPRRRSGCMRFPQMPVRPSAYHILPPFSLSPPPFLGSRYSKFWLLNVRCGS